MDPDVAALFNKYSADKRRRLMDLRATILATAAATAGVGAPQETLKWGQASYLTSQSGSGTTIRIDLDRASGRPTIYVNCQTDLVAGYREHYPLVSTIRARGRWCCATRRRRRPWRMSSPWR